MALGNWATLTVDHNGEGGDDEFEVSGFRAEIYKNWLYIYIKGIKTPITVNAGDLWLGGMKVLAETDASGRFFVAISEGFESDKKFRALFGLAVYGYDGDEWAGVRDSDVAAYMEWVAQMQSAKRWPQRDALPQIQNMRGGIDQGGGLIKAMFGS